MPHLVDFVVETGFRDLPEVVGHESKRVLLDSIVVAIAGLTIDQGKRTGYLPCLTAIKKTLLKTRVLDFILFGSPS